MPENPVPPASGTKDPPWPTLHPADNYDGERRVPDDDEGGLGQPKNDGDPDRRMYEQLKIANNEHPEGASE